MGLSPLATVFYYAFYYATLVLNSFLLYQIASRFLTPRPRLGWKILLGVTLGGSSAMIIWVGDPNLFYTFPVFFLLVLLCTQGDWVGRLAVTIIFFCIIMPVCAFLDTYMEGLSPVTLFYYDALTRLSRPAVFSLLYLFLRRRLPQEPIALPRRLWNLVLWLSFMPLLALVSSVLLAYPEWVSQTAYAMAMRQGLVLLPFSCITAVVLLLVILALAGHEQLEKQVHLAGLQEVYYQGLQREQTQVRTLRHDLRNHITAVQGLLAQGETDKAIRYLDQRSLTGTFQVSLPQDLPIKDADLCALLGNALDNAMEAAEKSDEKTISVRCRAEKGLFMLRVENPLAGDEQADLSTTKKDKAAHGFGLPAMREIARRYGGSLETRAADSQFELVVCLPL